MSPRLPVLMDELIEEILLFFPPDDPASLVRAALVRKSWCRIVSDPGFARRFREHHGIPSLLGIFCNISGDGDGEHGGGAAGITRFIPTSPLPPQADCIGARVLDVRHGRVLLHNTQGPPGCLAVWEPAVGSRRDLPFPPHLPQQICHAWNAAVLCAAAAPGLGTCKHVNCHGGPFLVVFLCISRHAGAFFSVYSSETESWSDGSDSCTVWLDERSPSPDAVGQSVLVGDAVHFPVGHEIFTFHLGRNRALSLLYAPLWYARNMCLVAAGGDGGGLGVAVAKGDSIRLWWWDSGIGAWKEGHFVIGLPDLEDVGVIGFAEGDDAIFVSAKGWIFMVDLKPQFPPRQPRIVCEMGPHFSSILPYVSFYVPDFRIL